MLKRSISILLISVMMFTSVSGVFAGSFNIWKAIEEASVYEANNELDKALPLWLDIITYYEEQTCNEGVYTNLAIFSKKVGRYYDGIKQYDNAVIYYEKENDNWLKVGNSWGAEDMLRAEEIRTIFEMYVEIDATDNNLAKYEPKAGILAGIYSENDKAIGQKFEKTTSVYGDHAQFILYQNWGHMISDNQYIDTTLAKKMKAENAAFHLALNPMNGLNAVTEDQWIVNWAKQAKSLDMPIFLRFAGEMNGDWVPWHGDPSLYIEKFKLVHDIMEKYAPNVVMVWTPNDAPVDSGGYRIEDYYPGDAYVDWVGVNFYVDYYDSGNVSEDDNFLQNPLSHLDYVYDLYAAKKPIMISETAVTHYSIPDQKDLTKWGVENLKKLYTQLPIKYPRVKAINYFSLNQANDNYMVGNRWNNYALSENSAIKAVYKTLIESKHYLGNINDSAETTFKEISDEDITDYDEIFFVVKIADYKINKAEFYDGDTLLGVDNELPYSYKADYKNVSNLIIKVYDSKNVLSYVKTFETEMIEEKISAVVSAGDITVTVPSFDVMLKGVKMNPAMSQYPLFVYKDVTYFPMTYNATQGLGLKADWNDTTKHLAISQMAPAGQIKEYIQSSKNPSTLGVTLPNFKISVNGAVLDNSKEDFPILVYNNVTYFPLTWKWMNDEFKWSSNFGTDGLHID